MFAKFHSIGAYVPSNVLSNADLEKMVDTSDEWILKRTGIKERRIANSDEVTSDMGCNCFSKNSNPKGRLKLKESPKDY